MDLITAEPVVRTNRIVLRRPMASDAPAIACLANDYGVAGMTALMPYPYGLADAEGWIARQAQRDPDTDLALVIEKAGQPAGVIGIHPGKDGHGFGYWLGRSYWGQGLATEAAVSLLDWVRRNGVLRYLRSGHFMDNPASGAVLVKAGFLYTGEVSDIDCLARGKAVPSRRMIWLA